MQPYVLHGLQTSPVNAQVADTSILYTHCVKKQGVPATAVVSCGVHRLSQKAKEQGSRFYQASVTTAASTAEGIKRLAQGEPLQVIRQDSQHSCM